MAKVNVEQLKMVGEVAAEVVAENSHFIESLRIDLMPNGFSITLYASKGGRTFATESLFSGRDLLSMENAQEAVRHNLRKQARMLQIKTSC